MLPLRSATLNEIIRFSRLRMYVYVIIQDKTRRQTTKPNKMRVLREIDEKLQNHRRLVAV